MPSVNPEVLVWARQTAGLSLEAASKSLSLGGKKASGAAVLASLEAGTREPTRPLLLKMASVYRRPLLVFYLPKPPQTADKGEDFRTLPEHLKADSNGTLDALVRDIYVRKELVKSALYDIEEAEKLSFVGSLSMEVPVGRAAEILGISIGFDINEFRKRAKPEDAFTYLRNLVEQAGVFVLLIGNLGSHHTDIPVEAFRGFALADEVAPFIVINDQDAPAARAFTLVHELAHIFLGVTGISGNFSEIKIERYCNDLASQLLLPDHDLAGVAWEFDGIADLVAKVAAYARGLNISGSLVAYRLLTSGAVSQDEWDEASRMLRTLWLEFKASQKATRKKDQKIPYYVVKRHKLGNSLVELVGRTMQEGSLTATKAARVLGVKPANVYNLVGA